MTLSLLGTQHFSAGYSESGHALTIPGGTVAIMVVGHKFTGTGDLTGNLGGISLVVSDHDGGASNESCTWYIEDISGRSNNTLTWAEAGAGRWSVLYIAGNAPAFLDGDIGFGNKSRTPAADAEAIGASVGHCDDIFGHDVVLASGMTSLWYATSPDKMNTGGYKVGATGAAVGIGVNSANGVASDGTASIWMHESAPEVVIEMTSMPGAQTGIPSAFEITADGAPGVLAHPFGIGGAEVGIPSGFSVSADSAAQVMLVRPGTEEVSNTEGGSEGQVLTYHTATKPTWEDAGGGASALDDLTDVDAPSPGDGEVLAWDDGTSMWVPVAPGTPTIDWAEDADISTFGYGDAPDAGALDEAARGDHVHGLDTVSCGVSRSADLTITASQHVLIPFTATDRWDTDGMHDPGGANPSHLTVPKAGLYLLTTTVIYSALNNAQRMVGYHVNGNHVDFISDRITSYALAAYVAGVAQMALAANDYVEVCCYANHSSGTLTATGKAELTLIGTV